MSKDATVQLKILKLNQMRLLTDLMGQINELKYSTTEPGIQTTRAKLDADAKAKRAKLDIEEAAIKQEAAHEAELKKMETGHQPAENQPDFLSGLAAISAAGTCAGYASLVVEADPRIYTAAQVADISGKALDAYEVEAESDKVATVKFESENDFEVVKHTNMDDYFIQLDDY
ncbi:1174_t:CDS:2 [Paraglomus brasilianum]|uniref:1174_t:CDS:1 n=1 Tax=Paraglomus brasilianum TaxID=144538 RepID=A0A9N9FNB6_9GLOM|nr:1174_t:CDS:2 [Paraglomus brasilianum]